MDSYQNSNCLSQLLNQSQVTLKEQNTTFAASKKKQNSNLYNHF